MHCSPPGSSVHGIFLAQILEWVAMSSCKESSWPRDQTCVSWDSCTAGRFFTAEPPGKPATVLILDKYRSAVAKTFSSLLLFFIRASVLLSFLSSALVGILPLVLFPFYFIDGIFSILLLSHMEKAMAPHSSTLALKNPMDGGAWWAVVHGVAGSRIRLSDFTFTFHFHALEKEMATHSSILAWRVPGTGEPGGLLSVGSHRVRHDWSDLAALSHRRCVFLFPIIVFPKDRSLFVMV